MAVELRDLSSPTMDSNTAPQVPEIILPPFEQKGVAQLLSEYLPRSKEVGEKMVFDITPGLTAHNPSVPFLFQGKEYIAVRADILEEELTSRVIICQNDKGVWKEAKELAVFQFENAEDPGITIIGGRPVLTFVRFQKVDDGFRLRQEFYLLAENGVFMPLPFTGPLNMKDIRLTPGDLVGVSGFGRPKEHTLGERTLYQGSGEGTISYFETETLGGINTELIEHASLLTGMFKEGEWGGVNQVHRLKNGLLGLIGHIAYQDEQERKHYYSIAFAFDSKTKQFSSLKIIATRGDFPEGKVKPVRSSKGEIREDVLQDIIFSGGLLRQEDGTARLFVGLSDAEAGVITIEDPFLEYEQLRSIPLHSPGTSHL